MLTKPCKTLFLNPDASNKIDLRLFPWWILCNSPPFAGLFVDERRRVDEEEEGLRDERLLEVEPDLEVRLEQQLLAHVRDGRRRPRLVAAGGGGRRRRVVAVAAEAAAADLAPGVRAAVQLGGSEEVEEAVPLGPLGHHFAVAAAFSNWRTTNKCTLLHFSSSEHFVPYIH